MEKDNINVQVFIHKQALIIAALVAVAFVLGLIIGAMLW
jgi:hypothetical protein